MISKRRHLAKAVTWRIIASTVTALIAWWFGLPAKAVGLVFAADLVIKFILYYAHERVWYTHIKYGVTK
jgi:uncharacterized membrane protein|tara:strand:- start:302 stop:508 length:207 start_codon:yes stop_codon:yes gene_type:complete